jgi:hypothetical protein
MDRVEDDRRERWISNKKGKTMIATRHFDETTFSPLMLNFVPLEIDGFFLGHVSQTLKSGYDAAVEAYNAYPLSCETDALLTEEEYRRLAAKSFQGIGDFAEYSRGFITAWVACVLGLIK